MEFIKGFIAILFFAGICMFIGFWFRFGAWLNDVVFPKED